MESKKRVESKKDRKALLERMPVFKTNGGVGGCVAVSCLPKRDDRANVYNEPFYLLKMTKGVHEKNGKKWVEGYYLLYTSTTKGTIYKEEDQGTRYYIADDMKDYKFTGKNKKKPWRVQLDSVLAVDFPVVFAAESRGLCPSSSTGVPLRPLPHAVVMGADCRKILSFVEAQGAVLSQYTY